MAFQEYTMQWMVTLFLPLLFLLIRYTEGMPCSQANGMVEILLKILESHPPGTVFKTLSMIEGDSAPNGTISLSLVDNPYFVLDGISKNLTLKSPLDLEGSTSSPISLVLKCLDKANKMPVNIPIRVAVEDVNDHPPQFEKSLYSIQLNEFTPPGTTITRDILAKDADVTNNFVEYSIAPGQYSDYFRLSNSLEGTLILNKPLSYEKLPSFNVTIIAKDQGDPPKNSSALVVVSVIDGDDLNPAFVKAPYSAVLPANAQTGYKLDIKPVPVKAYDQDVGINSSIWYEVLDDVDQYFSINRSTGEVFYERRIMTGEFYTLAIKATQEDNPNRYAVTTLRITLEGFSAIRPSFTQRVYFVTVPGNQPINSKILNVRAITQDQTVRLIYKLVNASFIEQFELTESGDLLLKKNLNVYPNIKYALQVEVTDGKNFDRADVHITVVHTNDHSPVFSKSSYFFAADREDPTIGKIEVTDADPNTRFTFSLIDPYDVFDIDDVGNVIMKNKDTSNNSEYHLIAVAHDNGIPPRHASVPVKISFPPVQIAGQKRAGRADDNSYVIGMIIMGGLAAILLLIIVLLIVYIGMKNKQWREKNKYMQRIDHTIDPGMRYPIDIPKQRLHSEDEDDDKAIDNPVFMLEQERNRHMNDVTDTTSTDSDVGPDAHSDEADYDYDPRQAPPANLRSGPSSGHRLASHATRKQKKLSWEDEMMEQQNSIDPDVSVTPWEQNTTPDKPELTVYF